MNVNLFSNPPAIITWYKNNVAFKDQGAFVYPFEGEDFQYHSGKLYNTFGDVLYEVKFGVFSKKITNLSHGQNFALHNHILK